jgi:tetratricopeptide (TPR) repeat protein
VGQHDTLFASILSLQNDTEKVNQLYANGFEIRNTNPQLAYKFASFAKKIALHTHAPKHIAKSYNLMGILFYKKGNYKNAIHYHKEALKIRSSINDVLGIAYSQTNLGNVYSDLKLYHKAEQAYLGALHAYKKINNPVKVIDCLINLGTLKHYLKQYDAAIENYLMALKMIPVNDYETKALCLSNLAEACLGKGEIEKALSYNEDALKLRTFTENKIESGDSYANLAGIYIITKEFEKAKECLDSANSIANYYDYSSLKVIVRKQYAYYFSETRNFELAFQWMKQYNNLRDSLQTEQELSKSKYDFDENDTPVFKAGPSNNFRGTWVLIIMALLGIGIPFILIQFKR